jgi:hypothetical protein
MALLGIQIPTASTGKAMTPYLAGEEAAKELEIQTAASGALLLVAPASSADPVLQRRNPITIKKMWLLFSSTS